VSPALTAEETSEASTLRAAPCVSDERARLRRTPVVACGNWSTWR
jgi:hypothetical protein